MWETDAATGNRDEQWKWGALEYGCCIRLSEFFTWWFFLMIVRWVSCKCPCKCPFNWPCSCPFNSPCNCPCDCPCRGFYLGLCFYVMGRSSLAVYHTIKSKNLTRSYRTRALRFSKTLSVWTRHHSVEDISAGARIVEPSCQYTCILARKNVYQLVWYVPLRCNFETIFCPLDIIHRW